MAENKTVGNLGGNLGTGAGFFAKRVQKSFNRAQEKVSCKLFLSYVEETLLETIYICK